MLLSPGQKIANFEIVRWLGRGAFADVYEARQVLMDRPVALKVITCDDRPSEEQLGEARLLASLSHPNIIQIYECGMHTDADGGGTCLYLVTELLRGGSLRDRLASSGRLPVEEAVVTAVAVCEGLAYAHARGVVHRDIKPENVLLTDDGTPKLADFGVSRLLSESQVASSVVGTAPYVAPEGWEGATHQSDVWAVGVLLYEMLRGAPPFTGKTPAEVERRIRKQAHTPLRDLVPGLPPGLEAAVDKALQKQPRRRFADADGLAEALRPYSGQTPQIPPVLAPPPQGMAEAVAVTFRRAAKGAARFVGEQSAGTIVFLLVAALIGFLGVQFSGRLGIAKRTVERIRAAERTPTVAPAPQRSASPAGQSALVPPPPPPAAGRDRGNAGIVEEARQAIPEGPTEEGTGLQEEGAEALYVQARARLQTGDREEAVTLLERCVGANPKHVTARMELAILYADSGKMGRSIEELEAVVGLRPGQLGARQMLARAYAQQGDTERAAFQWEAVLRLDPENIEAKQALQGQGQPGPNG